MLEGDQKIKQKFLKNLKAKCSEKYPHISQKKTVYPKMGKKLVLTLVLETHNIVTSKYLLELQH